MRELKSIHKMGIRLLKMIHREDSSVIPLHLLDVCLSLAQIYAGLFLTAGLIDALLAGAYREAAWQAVVLLGPPSCSAWPSVCSRGGSRASGRGCG